jgi:spore cortex formation protein SpoVR/YcgB (stage V sporulation)
MDMDIYNQVAEVLRNSYREQGGKAKLLDEIEDKSDSPFLNQYLTLN